MWCRLTQNAIVDGQPRNPGYEFDLAEGDPGPCRTEHLSHDRIDTKNDNARIPGKVISVPLYVKIGDKKPPSEEQTPQPKKSFFKRIFG